MHPHESTRIYRSKLKPQPAKSREDDDAAAATSSQSPGRADDEFEKELVAKLILGIPRAPDLVAYGGETKELREMFPVGRGVMEKT